MLFNFTWGKTVVSIISILLQGNKVLDRLKIILICCFVLLCVCACVCVHVCVCVCGGCVFLTFSSGVRGNTLRKEIYCKVLNHVQQSFQPLNKTVSVYVLVLSHPNPLLAMHVTQEFLEESEHICATTPEMGSVLHRFQLMNRLFVVHCCHANPRDSER